jgi:hypothetical protein
MLLLVEQDRVLGTHRALRRFCEFVSTPQRRAMRIVLFRSSAEGNADQILRAYPRSIRRRIVITPETPRSADLAFWLHYEICCATAALRFVGAFQADEPWLAVVPPGWMGALGMHFLKQHFLSTPGEFDEDARRRLRAALHSSLGNPILRPVPDQDRLDAGPTERSTERSSRPHKALASRSARARQRRKSPAPDTEPRIRVRRPPHAAAQS